MRERRVVLSKHMAQIEMQTKINSMKLSKDLQDEFFRRYDIFEKKAFQTTYSSNRTRSTRNLSSIDNSVANHVSSFIKYPNGKEPTTDELINKPFDRNVKNFMIKRMNPVYRSMSTMASIDNIKVALDDGSGPTAS